MRRMPEIMLRLGLGLMYLYSGYDLVAHPTAWVWAVRGLPLALQRAIDAVGIERFLTLQGVIELAFAGILFAWFLPKRFAFVVAGIAAAEILAILTLVGIDAITFRDIGLLGAALALAFLVIQPTHGDEPR